MGRPPPINGKHASGFTQSEVAEMEAIFHQHHVQIPPKDLLTYLAEKFSQSAERAGKTTIQLQQVWNWFQHRRLVPANKSLIPTGFQSQPVQTAFTTPFRLNLYWTSSLPLLGGIINFHNNLADATICIDHQLSFEELVKKVCAMSQFDRNVVQFTFYLIWSEPNGMRKYAVIRENQSIPVLFMYAFNYPELFVSTQQIPAAETSKMGNKGSQFPTDFVNSDLLEALCSKEEFEDANVQYMWDGNIESIGIGVKFESKEVMETAMAAWSARKRVTFSAVYSDPMRCEMECLAMDDPEGSKKKVRPNCGGNFFAAKQPVTGNWKLLSWDGKHSCAARKCGITGIVGRIEKTGRKIARG